MSPEISKETKARLTKWADDQGLEYSELAEKFQVKYAMLEKMLEGQDVPAKTIESKARSQIGNEIRPGRSRALTYEGIVLGFARAQDWNEFQFNIARYAYNEDSVAAADEGLVDGEGNPLWTQEEIDKKGDFFKGKVGDLILPQYERHVLAIGRPVKKATDEDEAIRLFWINLSGEPAVFNEANPAPMPGQVCRWRCNIQETVTELNLIRANGATVTKFTPASFIAGAGTDREKVLEGILDPKMCRSLLNQVNTSFKDWDLGDDESRGLEPGDLKEWLEAHSNKKGRLTPSHFAVMETEIMGVYKSGIRIGNADQQDLTDIPNIFVNLDENIVNQMFYGEGSTILIAIEPFLRKKKVDRKVVMDENNKPVKEVTAECVSIFPVIAMPRAEPKAEEAKAEAKETPTIEL